MALMPEDGQLKLNAALPKVFRFVKDVPFVEKRTSTAGNTGMTFWACARIADAAIQTPAHTARLFKLTTLDTALMESILTLHSMWFAILIHK